MAARIVQFQLAWQRAAGLLSVVIALWPRASSRCSYAGFRPPVATGGRDGAAPVTIRDFVIDARATLPQPMRPTWISIPRLYRRAILIYVLTIVIPVCGQLWLDIESFDRQRQALATLGAEKWLPLTL